MCDDTCTCPLSTNDSPSPHSKYPPGTRTFLRRYKLHVISKWTAYLCVTGVIIRVGKIILGCVPVQISCNPCLTGERVVCDCTVTTVWRLTEIWRPPARINNHTASTAPPYGVRMSSPGGSRWQNTTKLRIWDHWVHVCTCISRPHGWNIIAYVIWILTKETYPSHTYLSYLHWKW